MCVFFFLWGGGSEQRIKLLECANTNLILAMLLVISVHWSHYMLDGRFENYLLKGRLEGFSSHNCIYYAHKSQLLTQHLMWYGLSWLPFESEHQFGKMNRIMSRPLKAFERSLSPRRNCYVLFIWMYGKMVCFSENFYQIPFIFLYHLQICTKKRRNLVAIDHTSSG